MGSGLGIQNDEALFADGIYPPVAVAASVRLFHHNVPTMLLNYLGALKTWIYSALFLFRAPSPAAVRLPTLFFGGATVWLFYFLLRRGCGERIAKIGGALLATDTMFLLTTVLDWGPVALQHLLLIGALYLLALKPKPARIAAGFFLLGLGSWDKALFVWMLVGVSAGALAAFPKQIFQRLTPRNITVAGVFFCLGALPLILFNARNRLETFRGNASLSAGDRDKLGVLWSSLDGTALGGWLVRDDSPDYAREPQSPLERGSTWLSGAAGHPSRSLQAWAFVAALLLSPFAWFSPWRKAFLFAAVSLGVGFAQMYFGRGVGGTIHHLILLWPFPQFLMAIVFAATAQRWGRYGTAAVVILLTLLCGSNLLLTNEYYARMVRNGGALNWTDAVFPLSAFLKNTAARSVTVVDWGYADTLRLLNQGKLPLRQAISQLSRADLDDAGRAQLREFLAAPESLFVSHTEGNEFFPGSRSRLLAFAATEGYRENVIQTVRDRNGRAIFEVLQFGKVLP